MLSTFQYRTGSVQKGFPVAREWKLFQERLTHAFRLGPKGLSRSKGIETQAELVSDILPLCPQGFSRSKGIETLVIVPPPSYGGLRPQEFSRAKGIETQGCVHLGASFPCPQGLSRSKGIETEVEELGETATFVRKDFPSQRESKHREGTIKAREIICPQGLSRSKGIETKMLLHFSDFAFDFGDTFPIEGNRNLLANSSVISPNSL